mmetsp:Transcript_153489/g.490716  ORF Transcript_153489/g.490716 Transcript_153489/m.490716 type:complete len:735 (-) Transcript_153489:49-2253(-)
MPRPSPPSSLAPSFKELLDLLSAEHSKVSAENARLSAELGEARRAAGSQGESTPGEQALSDSVCSVCTARTPHRLVGIQSDDERLGAEGSAVSGALPQCGIDLRADDLERQAFKDLCLLSGRSSSTHSVESPTRPGMCSEDARDGPVGSSASSFGGHGVRSSWQELPCRSRRSWSEDAWREVQMARAGVSNGIDHVRHWRIHRLVLNPENSTFLERWDLVTMTCLSWVAVVTPVQLSLMKEGFNAFFGLNCLVDLLFAFDLCLQFFVAFQMKTDYGHIWVTNHRRISRHYVRTWFPIDAVSIIPFDLLGLLIDSPGVEHFKALKILRLLRILKLLRVLRASRLMHRMESRMSITYATFNLLKFFTLLGFVTHWLACLWCLTLVLVDEGDGVPRWVDGFAANEEQVAAKTKDTAWKLYVQSFYFVSYTITSVGYGDIGPQNIIETIVLTWIVIVSGVLWTLVLGEACATISAMKPDEVAFHSTMDDLNRMMHDRLVPPQMKLRLRTFFLARKTAQRRQRQMQIIDGMSPGLAGEVVMELNRVWITKVRFLDNILKSSLSKTEGNGSFFYAFVVDVARSMLTAIHAQSEVFGQPQALYILSRGLVSRRLDPTHKKMELADLNVVNSAGAVWGVDFVLVDLHLLEPAESLALTYVEAMMLKRETFLSLVERHDIYCTSLKAQVRRFCAWLAFQRAILRMAKRRRKKRDQAAKEKLAALEVGVFAPPIRLEADTNSLF